MKQVLMVAYTIYSSDARVRREAETVADIPGYEVTVLVIKEKERPRVYESGKVVVRELDIPKYRGKSNANYIFSYLRFTFRAFLACTKLTARRSLDLLHVHNMPNFLIFCGILPLLCGKPVILDIHDTMVETYAAKFDGKERKFLAWLLRMEEAICCRLARRIVCVNDIQKLALVRRKVPEEKIVVAMNLPDPKVFNHSRPIRVRPRIDSQFRLIYHGTVTKRIGVDRAIQAVAELNGKVPGLELHIVGDGDDLDEFRELGYSMNAGDTIHFHGRVPLDSLVGILEDMDLGIIPNGRNEATELMLPVKMLECMALGIPVVAPRLLAIKHYFSENMVFFFDPGNIPSMVDAISQACQSEESRLEKARAARGFLLENGWDTHKSGFIGLYRDLEN